MDGSATTHPRSAPAGAAGAGGPVGPDRVAARAADRGAGRGLLRVLPAVLAAAVVLAQITYPLLSGEALRLSTIVTVLLFATASLVHAAATRGARTALAVLVVAGGLGLLAETVGVRTGVPFGEYSYADSLGAKLLGVPVVVPPAWTMMAWPCLLLGRRLATGVAARRGRTAARAVTAATGGLTLAAWDLYLDPQMVHAGHWTWRFPEPALPGVPGVPLTNYAGWVVVALVMVAALDAVVPGVDGGGPDDGRPDDGRPDDGAADVRTDLVPAALLAWTWLGSGLANLAFFDRPAVAAYGLVAMGVCTAPYLFRVARLARGVRGVRG